MYVTSSFPACPRCSSTMITADGVIPRLLARRMDDGAVAISRNRFEETIQKSRQTAPVDARSPQKIVLIFREIHQKDDCCTAMEYSFKVSPVAVWRHTATLLNELDSRCSRVLWASSLPPARESLPHLASQASELQQSMDSFPILGARDALTRVMRLAPSRSAPVVAFRSGMLPPSKGSMR